MTKKIQCVIDNVPLWKYRNPESPEYRSDFGLILDFVTQKDEVEFETIFGIKGNDNYPILLNIIGLRKKRVYSDSFYYLNLDMISLEDVTYDVDHNFYTIDARWMSETDAKRFMSRDIRK